MLSFAILHRMSELINLCMYARLRWICFFLFHISFFRTIQWYSYYCIIVLPTLKRHSNNNPTTFYRHFTDSVSALYRAISTFYRHSIDSPHKLSTLYGYSSDVIPTLYRHYRRYNLTGWWIHARMPVWDDSFLTS